MFVQLIIVASIMQFPIDLDQYDRREQLKKSGLGKVGPVLYDSVDDLILLSFWW